MSSRQTSGDDGLRRDKPKSGEVALTMAHHHTFPPNHPKYGADHPWAKAGRGRVRVIPGEVIALSRDEARGLITAGYATVDPENPAQVTEALA